MCFSRWVEDEHKRPTKSYVQCPGPLLVRMLCVQSEAGKNLGSLRLMSVCNFQDTHFHTTNDAAIVKTEGASDRDCSVMLCIPADHRAKRVETRCHSVF